MAITGSEQAYTFARSGQARSGATRSGYVLQNFTVDWIVRDQFGNVTSRTELSAIVLVDSLHITQAINDEPDTCSFSIGPHLTTNTPGSPEFPLPIPVPKCGDEIIISAIPTGGQLFHGFVLTAQDDWRLNMLQPPWTSFQCVDPMWRFDARMVTFQFPAGSVTNAIADLVRYFCNNSPTFPHPLDFSLAYVTPGMPSIPAYDVVNQRPSTVLRTLTQLVNGGFYIDGLNVHAWANSVSEPGQTNPAELIPMNPHLITFSRSIDATQLRRRMLVEGKRTSTLTAIPQVSAADARGLGVPLQDASFFPAGAPTTPHLIRWGTQWAIAKGPVRVTVDGANPPQTALSQAFVVGSNSLFLKAMPVAPPAAGWVRVGNQYARYTSIAGTPSAGEWQIILAPASAPYGRLTVPIPVDETVEWTDAILSIEPHGLLWDVNGSTVITVGDPTLRAQPIDTPVVVLYEREVPFHDGDGRAWPQLEGFAQDGRYSYPGAQARGDSELQAFINTSGTYTWETTDPYALPGRQQAISLLGSQFPGGGIVAGCTILSVDISFPLRTLPPRRHCVGGNVEASTFMDLVVTETN